MKNVCMVTCYVNNFGACLQAYALQKKVIEFGNNCQIMKYTPVSSVKEYHALPALKRQIKNYIRLVRYRDYSYTYEREKCFNKFRKENLIMGKKNYLNLSDIYSDVPQYDVFLVGSDQLWNPLIHGNKNNKAYFLDFVPSGKKRIAYAPSIGLDVLPEEFKEEMAIMLSKFDTLSTREQTGAAIITELTGRACKVVLDPTLLLTGDEWNKLAIMPEINEPYIFCYLFGTTDYIGRFVRYVAEKTKYKIVVIPFTNREYSSSYMKIKKVDPLKFIGLIKNASLVITDSFHATAFSINFNTPFYSLLRNTDSDKNNMNSRIYNILNLTGFESKMVASQEDFPKIIDMDVDFSKANKIIAQKRMEDLVFLSNAINSDKKYE